MDERLLVQLERIEELKKELSKSRERENVLRDKFKCTPDVECEMQRLQHVEGEMQRLQRMVAEAGASSRIQMLHVQVSSR